MDQLTGSAAALDLDRFSLRRFMAELKKAGELAEHSEPVQLAELEQHLFGAEKAVLFNSAGPEKAQVLGNVMGNRKRLAMAFGVPEGELLKEVMHRLNTPQDIVQIPREKAPVQQIVLEGDAADLTKLPVPFQHGLDGGNYISASIDYVKDPDTGWTNVGIRRLMLRGRRETGIDAVSPSDLRAIYEKVAKKGQRLPIAFELGSHPIDFVAGTMRLPEDELGLVAKLRGTTLPVVKCVTNDLLVPADAEIILEGYLDEKGHHEIEGPFGEFLGYYGHVKHNPVFHLTAITMRKDALFQTATIGGRLLGRTCTAQLNALRTEAVAWGAVVTAIREPVSIYVTPSSGGMYNLRLSMRTRVPGEPRNAMAAIFGCLANVKNVFIVDDDIDIFSDEQMDWALATRFQPERDLFVESGFRTLPLDPSLAGEKTGSKAGFDLTVPFSRRGALEFMLPEPPVFGPKTFDTVAQALQSGPMHFGEILGAVGSRDGREVTIALDELRQAGKLKRQEDGKYALK
jgi:2,5-furandicarboxylate decarboxylase 1